MSQLISELPLVLQNCIRSFSDADWAAFPEYFSDEPFAAGFLDDALQIIFQLDEPLLIEKTPLGIAKFAAIARGYVDPWVVDVFSVSSSGDRFVARVHATGCLRENGQSIEATANFICRLTPDLALVSEVVMSAHMRTISTAPN